MMYPLVVELAAEQIPVVVTCRVLKFSPQAFYKWKAKPMCDRDWSDAYVVNQIVDIHADDPEFGYRFVTDELARQGVVVSENRVQRLCQQHRVWSVLTKKGRKGKRVGPAVHDDLVQRNFTAVAKDELWLTDITEHPTGEGKLYLCAVKDVWSNRIVGYSMAERMTASLAVTAIGNAVAMRGPAGTVLHSDRGSQFRSRLFTQALADGSLIGSMGRVGAAGDNAAMESFFSLLQKNVLDRKVWQTRDQLRRAIVIWIEATYHRRRKQRNRGRLTPIEYETINQATKVA